MVLMIIYNTVILRDVKNGDPGNLVCKKIGVPFTSLKIKEVGRLPARLESRKPNADGVFKPRPLRITFEEQEGKMKVLKHAAKLATIDHWNNRSTHKGVFIQPDKTKAERDLDYKLRIERRTRMEAGETNLVIRNGKLETRQQQ